jgi:hypothetical protein
MAEIVFKSAYEMPKPKSTNGLKYHKRGAGYTIEYKTSTPIHDTPEAVMMYLCQGNTMARVTQMYVCDGNKPIPRQFADIIDHIRFPKAVDRIRLVFRRFSLLIDVKFGYMQSNLLLTKTLLLDEVYIMCYDKYGYCVWVEAEIIWTLLYAELSGDMQKHPINQEFIYNGKKEYMSYTGGIGGHTECTNSSKQYKCDVCNTRFYIKKYAEYLCVECADYLYMLAN